jgi:lipopolysaccharide export system permease protein
MILFWYIFIEMIFPFLIVTGVISSVLLMNQIFGLIPFLQIGGFEVAYVVQMVVYSLPSILMISMPISVIIGVYAGVNRLSTDHELIVIRSTGQPLFFIYRPVLLLALIIASAVMINTFYFSPIGVTRLEDLKYQIVKKTSRINLSVGKINRFLGKKLIYIFDKDGDLFKGVFISEWEEPTRNGFIEAKSGRIIFNEEQRSIIFHLLDGRIHSSPGEGEYRIIDFKEMNYNLNTIQRDSGFLPSRFREENWKNRKTLDTGLSSLALWRKIRKTKSGSKAYLEGMEEFHGRIVTVLSCFCFAIIAIPLAIYNLRNPKGGNIIYLIGIMVLFFMILVVARNMVAEGKLPLAAMYTPVVLAIFLALFRYLKINQDMESTGEMLRRIILRKQ